MKALRRIAHLTLDMNKLHADLVVKLYLKLGLYRLLY